MPAHQIGEQPGAGQAEQSAGDDSGAEQQQGVLDLILFGNGELEHQHRQQGADGVDQDAFPAQDAGDFALRANAAQQRGHHGGAGDGDQRAEQQRHGPGQVHAHASGERDEQPVDQRAERDQVADHPSLATNFRKAQG